MRRSIVALIALLVIGCSSPMEPEDLFTRVEIKLSGDLASGLYLITVRVRDGNLDVEFESMAIRLEGIFIDPIVHPLTRFSNYYIATNVQLPWSVYNVFVTGIRAPGAPVELLHEGYFISKNPAG